MYILVKENNLSKGILDTCYNTLQCWEVLLQQDADGEAISTIRRDTGVTWNSGRRDINDFKTD